MWQQGGGSMSRSKVVGRRVSVSVSHACGSWPLAFAVASRPMIAATRRPAVFDPTVPYCCLSLDQLAATPVGIYAQTCFGRPKLSQPKLTCNGNTLLQQEPGDRRPDGTQGSSLRLARATPRRPCSLRLGEVTCPLPGSRSRAFHGA